ncbi:carbohydrate ABC transporter permease [Amphibacillus jilinensis]|uniref:carbohydrate ABC transporter permease n=1 Tax=Amphibacillus jilinensis TaxID=1216008 RepID=UPI0003712958|nr:carbohydrate ABC transporter permease [Amphibacillus jilinensis]
MSKPNVEVSNKSMLGRLFRKNNKNIIGIFTVVLALLFISPYIYIVLTSIKPSSDAISSSPTFFPRQLSLENYVTMFNQMPIIRYFLNSFTTASISTILAVFLGALAAYGLSRFSSKTGHAFLLLTLCVRMIPMISIAIPMYIIINVMGLIDTRIALIITYTAINVPFSIWLMIGFFNNIPKEFDEAARIDGCNVFSAFIKVILPVSLPGLATAAIFCFMLAWNDFLFALLLTSTNAKTATVGISEFLTAYNLDLGPMTAAAVSFSLPIMVFSILVQRYIVSGMTLGAVKE